jgi:hypothetical protein
MKRLVFSSVVIVVLASALPAGAQCNKIKDGTIQDVNGNFVTIGYDKYGYNYQAHLFNGLVDNYLRPAVIVTEGDENLVMKWSDDWLANVDCNQDGKLDRGLDPKTLVAGGISKGWVTNHFEGDYLGSDNEMHHYTYFAKIVWVGQAQAVDPWASVRIWGEYAIIEEIQTDLFGEYGGRLKAAKLVAPGLGRF